MAEHLRPLVADGTVPGLVCAVVTPGGQATGHLSRSGTQPLGPHVLLEIGSVTKVFTALLLADMAERREVQLDDPIARHLPPAVAQACPAAARITLRQLATHTSGLPRLPRNLVPLALRHPADPYAGYSTEHLYRALRKANTRPRRIISTPTMALACSATCSATPRAAPTASCSQSGSPGHSGSPRPCSAYRMATPPRPGTGAAAHRPLAPGRAGRRGRAELDRGRPGPLPQREPSPGDDPGPLGDRGHPAPGRQPADRARLAHLLTRGRPVLWHNGATGGFSAMLALDRDAGCAIGAMATSAPARHQPLDGAVLTALTELIQPAPVPGS